MRNRAKCKLCSSIVESFLPDEIVYCKCGEIAVCDGAAMRCVFNDIRNFLRVDELGNEIVVSYKEKGEEGTKDEGTQQPQERLSKRELIDMVDSTIENLEKLPLHHVTSIDLANCMLMLINILKRE